jgi:hypothetical protein
MIMNEHERTEKIFRELDRLAFWVSVILLATLTILYFIMPQMGFISESVQTFLLAVITNLIPTILFFSLSYILVRRFQILRAESSQKAVADDLAKAIEPILDDKITTLANSVNEKISGISNSQEQLKQNVHAVQESLMSLWQQQENSQKIIDGLIDKLPIATPKAMTDFLGSVNKIGRNPKLPKTTLGLSKEE